MREILFRGKRVDNGQWVYGYYVKANKHWHEKGVHKDWIVTSATQNGGLFVVSGRYAVVPETVGMFTGLVDKKDGKRIFEGDVLLRWDNDWEEFIGEKRVLSYGFDECDVYSVYGFSPCDEKGKQTGDIWLGNYYNDGVAEDVAVVGNIHDNPELMKGE